jgi:hypothetical protein
MTEPEHRWAARGEDFRRIWEHLQRQRDIDTALFVRLDDDRIVIVGYDAKGEDT